MIMKCKNPTGYHNTKLIKEVKEQVTDFTSRKKFIRSVCFYECDDCRSNWIVHFTPWGDPVDIKLYSEIMAKDILQPSHPDFEKVYGKKQKDFVRDEHKKNIEGENNKKEMRENIADFKQHYSKGKVHI